MTEGKCTGKQTGRLFEEINARKEYSEKGGWTEYLQFVLITKKLIFFIGILNTQVKRNEFSF
ncbi:MAG: hypothetical protein ABSB22_17550 [Thermodesulfobacteriota bacterium]